MSISQRIVRPETAFSLSSSRRKRPRIENKNHLAFIRSLPCVVCGTRRNVEAAHVRMGNPLYGKSQAGMQEKSDDRWTVSLCPRHHDEQHGMNEADFWMALDIDPLRLGLALFDSTGDQERAESIIRSHRNLGDACTTKPIGRS
jgi:hypothetical protein